jgi:hypothetical protein
MVMLVTRTMRGSAPLALSAGRGLSGNVCLASSDDKPFPCSVESCAGA